MEYKKSFVFTEIHIKNVEHLLKCYFKPIFVILVASKRQTYRFEFITSRILIPEYGESNALKIKSMIEGMDRAPKVLQFCSIISKLKQNSW